MIKKILQTLWQSKINIPRRIVHKFLSFNSSAFHFFSVRTEIQDRLFQSVNLDRQKGINKLDNTLKKYFSITYNEQNGMFSEHLILFSAISVSNNNIRKILEIGTYDGKSALILGDLFPDSKVQTIDLSEESPIFRDTYGRADRFSDFIKDRNERLKLCKNVSFESINSLNLVSSDERFDLIWIDGAHGYPIIAMDIINSFRLSNPGGYILIDDVWLRRTSSDQMYRSVGALESLEALKTAGLIEHYYLFHKRLGSIFNSPTEKKFVALCVKPK